MAEKTRAERGPSLTLRDVSELSGVSEMTASRVLRNRGEVSAQTREKVMAAARSLGYVPNKIAGALASNQVNLIGVIIPSISNLVFPDVMAGISEVLDQTPFQPVVGITGYDLEKEEQVIFELLSWRPSGLIVAGLEHTEASRKMLKNSGIPIVEIMDVDGDPIDGCVGISHRRAGRETANEIVRRGYRKIGFLGTKMPLDKRAKKRFDGFVEALSENGLSLCAEEYYSGGSALKKGRAMTEDILERVPDLDFLYYSNDVIGVGGQLLLEERGVNVPQNLGLAGFNGLEIIEGLPRRLATLDSCRKEIGTAAAKLIAKAAAEETSISGEVVELSPVFDPGDTMRSS